MEFCDFPCVLLLISLVSFGLFDACLVQGWHILLFSGISIVVIFLKNIDLTHGSLTLFKSALAIVSSRGRQMLPYNITLCCR